MFCLTQVKASHRSLPTPGLLNDTSTQKRIHPFEFFPMISQR